MVQVKIVERKGEAVLLEWLDDGKLQRGSVPAAKVEGNQCDASVLASAIGYGEAWEKLDLPNLDAEALAEGLRVEGVWTKEDFIGNLHLVRAAVQRVYLNPFISALTARLKK